MTGKAHDTKPHAKQPDPPDELKKLIKELKAAAKLERTMKKLREQQQAGPARVATKTHKPKPKRKGA